MSSKERKKYRRQAEGIPEWSKNLPILLNVGRFLDLLSEFKSDGE